MLSLDHHPARHYLYNGAEMDATGKGREVYELFAGIGSMGAPAEWGYSPHKTAWYAPASLDRDRRAVVLDEKYKV